MSANGISTLSTKLARQTAKLDIAQLKRKGYATIVQNTTAYSLPTNFSLGDIKITVNNVDDVYLHFYNSVPTISNQLKVGMIVTIDWDGRAPNTVATIASQLIDFPGHDWRAQGLGFLLTIITTTELPGNSEDYNIEALHIPNGTFTGSGSPDTSKVFYRVNNTYDLTLLPDTYATAADDNANTGGLVQGRPWLNIAGITFAANIWRTDYEGYFYDTPSFFDTAALKAAPNDYNGTDTTINEPALVNNTSIQYKGYFLATYTGTHTFYLNTDDGSYMWIGLNALSGYTTANALVQNGGLHGVNEVSATISLVAGTYYPLRIQFGNGPAGPGVMVASYEHSGQAKTSTWTGKIFYNTATNGF